MPELREDASPNRITLRPWHRADLAAAYVLDQVCFPVDIAYSRAELLYFVSRASTYGVVAEDGVAGMAGFLLASTRRKTRALAHIITLDVAPEHRRSGVASALMRDAEQHCRASSTAGLELEVAVDNEPAQRFYLKHGFEPAGLLRGYYNGRLDAIRMRKLLL